MNNPTFQRAIRRVRIQHYLHFAAQAGLMAGVVLAVGRRVAGGTSENPKLATWPVLFGMLALLAVVGVLVHVISSYIKPNLRRPAAENLRLYQGRIFLRDSLLGLAGLPPLAAYALSGNLWNLLFFCLVLLVPCVVAAPSVRTYQRWLIG